MMTGLIELFGFTADLSLLIFDFASDCASDRSSAPGPRHAGFAGCAFLHRLPPPDPFPAHESFVLLDLRDQVFETILDCGQRRVALVSEMEPAGREPQIERTDGTLVGGCEFHHSMETYQIGREAGQQFFQFADVRSNGLVNLRIAGNMVEAQVDVHHAPSQLKMNLISRPNPGGHFLAFF